MRRTVNRVQEHPAGLTAPGQEGLALVVALIALCLVSLLGFYLALNSTTEVRISDNYESHVRARFAALAGVNHARELLRGVEFNDLLRGPDGVYDGSAGYLSRARTFAFRNPIGWTMARSLDIIDPAADVAGMPDDGLVNSGTCGAVDGTILIPSTGIAQTVSDPYGPGTITISRYFVKVSDNNGEATEIARDATDNPFIDGDGIIVVRSIGVSGTIRENTDAKVHRNAVAAYEARFKRYRTFQLGAALVVQGVQVQPAGTFMFEGTVFHIRGGSSNPGIGAIDLNADDAISPAGQILSSVTPDQAANIEGMGLSPSVQDISGSINADPDKSLLFNREYVWNFANSAVSGYADNAAQGSQIWTPGNAPDLGTYDPALPWNDPSQHPKVTFVNGDLSLSGALRGGGLLIVTGRLTVDGGLAFNGLVLIIGTGEFYAVNMKPGVKGGIYLAKISGVSGSLSWGIPRLTLSGESVIIYDSPAIDTAVRLIAPSQVSFREVTSAMDP